MIKSEEIKTSKIFKLDKLVPTQKIIFQNFVAEVC